MFNSLGNLFRITTFGESHGPSMGVIIDGCPAGIEIDSKFIQTELDRRKPGQSKITTGRKEKDEFEILSGIFEGKTTGTPICILIKNKDIRSKDYTHIADKFRPSHADFTYQQKFGTRDYRGGGRSSARETVNWVASGAIAKLILNNLGVKINAYVSEVGEIKCPLPYHQLSHSQTESSIVRCPDIETANKMIGLIEKTKKQGDTVGGVITAVVTGTPVGIGEPVFHKLHAELGKAMLSINAVKGFEFGSGFEGSKMLGSEHNDAFYIVENQIKTRTNYSGGIQGGISNGEDIYFRVAFKPVATIMKDQESVNVDGEGVVIKGRGRHDPCVVPRAVPIVEALAALVIVDFYLIAQCSKLRD